ncbi:MAG: hypothetical protein IPL46_04190 [Saprospiraceae bacterium]|nr:hypothetical protein [Saprospiraceae bacterium]
MIIRQATIPITRIFFLSLFSIISFECFSQLQLEWETRTLTNFDISNHIVRLDDQQNIFIAGENNSDSIDVDVYKFSTSGELIWHFHYDGDSMLNDAVADLLIDQEGNALLTGYSYERYMQDYDVVLDESYRAYIIKLDSNGELDWMHKYGIEDTARSKGLLLANYNDSTYLTLTRREHGERWSLSMQLYDRNGNLLKDSLIYKNPTIMKSCWAFIPHSMKNSISRFSGLKGYSLIS